MPPEIPIHAVDDADLRDYAARLSAERWRDLCDADKVSLPVLRGWYIEAGRLADRLQMCCKQNELLLHEKNTEIEKLKAKLAKAKGKSDE